MSSIFSTIAITAGFILLIPLAILAERADFNTWQSRLAFPEFRDSVNRHTPLHAVGTVLPPTITTNLTLTAADDPIVLVRETIISPGVTLTLEGGANVFAHEFATLSVFGTLRMQGRQSEPIILTTNERHGDNQVWNGIVLVDGARADIAHAAIRYAAPGLTCLPGSAVTTDHLEMKYTNQDIFGC